MANSGPAVQLAWNEYRHFMTSPGIWLLTGLCILFGVMSLGSGAVPETTARAVNPRSIVINGPPPESVLGRHKTIAAPTPVLSAGVLLAGVLMGTRSIAAAFSTETATELSGTARQRLGLLAGTIVGRSGALATSVTITFLGVGLIGAREFGLFSIPAFLALLGLSIAYGILAVCLGVALRTAVTGRWLRRALTGVFLFLTLVWTFLVLPVIDQFVFGVDHSIRSPSGSEPLLILTRLAPREAYLVTVNWILGLGNRAVTYDALETNGPHDTTHLFELYGGQPPLPLEPWFALVILGCWLVLAGGVASLQFAGKERSIQLA